MVVTICLDAVCRAMGKEMRRDKSFFKENIMIGGVLQRSFFMLFGRVLEDLWSPSSFRIGQRVCTQHSIAVKTFLSSKRSSLLLQPLI